MKINVLKQRGTSIKKWNKSKYLTVKTSTVNVREIQVQHKKDNVRSNELSKAECPSRPPLWYFHSRVRNGK